MEESAALVDDIGMLLKTLEFERKLHEQESQHLRKVASCEAGSSAKKYISSSSYLARGRLPSGGWMAGASPVEKRFQSSIKSECS